MSKAASQDPNNGIRLPSHDVFVTEQREGENSAYWMKIGAAWEHCDGEGFSVQLSATPVNGRLVLRTRKEKAGE